MHKLQKRIFLISLSVLFLRIMEELLVKKPDLKVHCFHCGDECRDKSIHINEKYFCCNGCRTVYEMLYSNDMCTYYSIDDKPGISKKNDLIRNFDFLEDLDLQNKLIDFTDGKVTTITFFIPQMHCSSCIWILENLYKLNSGIKQSSVNFLKKSLSIKYAEKEISLKELVELLDSLGYLPSLNFDEKTKVKSENVLKKLYYKIGIAGFAFGNIMLLSFPEYLSIQDIVTDNIKVIFGTINMILALPVLFYSGSEYYISAWKGLKKSIINIDVPITLGIMVLFFRSYYELLSQTGAGYLDSMTALIFFLLIGKLFQHKTYDALNFERNFKSYFPIAVTIIKNGIETTKPVEKLKVGERILIKNNEIIPADSVLISDKTNIDYSFVTGESSPVVVNNGKVIYAGGKQIGASIMVETIKEVSQSYLTQLWNQDAFHKDYHSNINSLVTIVSKYFTAIILAISSAAFIYWFGTNTSLAFNAFTAVLIIACPCALALSTPFTLGNTLRIFGRNKFYVKNTDVVEKLSSINSIVFDKTGTITETGNAEIKYIGEKLDELDLQIIVSVTKNSSHPLSKQICEFYGGTNIIPVSDYNEKPGLGISANVNGIKVSIGSYKFIYQKEISEEFNLQTRVYYSVEGVIKGYFAFKNKYREGLKETIQALRTDYDISLLSGDNESERNNLLEFFDSNSQLLFGQSPFDKLEFVKKLQSENKYVLMIGDGLNDAGALKQSNVGISLSEDINNFSPACDGIMEAKSFNKLKDFISFSRVSKKIIIISFIVSFLYNLIGLAFAVQGQLSPVIAAILMPISSISVVVFTTLATNFMAKRHGLLQWK